MSRSETAKRVNRHEPDPITGRVMADRCWDGDHHPKCSGWLEACTTCEPEHNRHYASKWECECECHGPCDCECHKDYPRPARKQKPDKSLVMHIMDSGCGVIEV